MKQFLFVFFFIFILLVSPNIWQNKIDVKEPKNYDVVDVKSDGVTIFNRLRKQVVTLESDDKSYVSQAIFYERKNDGLIYGFTIYNEATKKENFHCNIKKPDGYYTDVTFKSVNIPLNLQFFSTEDNIEYVLTEIDFSSVKIGEELIGVSKGQSDYQADNCLINSHVTGNKSLGIINERNNFGFTTDTKNNTEFNGVFLFNKSYKVKGMIAYSASSVLNGITRKNFCMGFEGKQDLLFDKGFNVEKSISLGIYVNDLSRQFIDALEAIEIIKDENKILVDLSNKYKGLLVSSVSEGGYGYKIGLKPGDIIVGINNKAVITNYDLGLELLSVKENDTIKFDIQRLNEDNTYFDTTIEGVIE